MECNVCKKEIKIDATFKTEWKCQKNSKCILGVVLLAIVIVVMIALLGSGVTDEHGLPDAAAYAIIGVFLVLILTVIILSMRHRTPKTCHITVSSAGGKDSVIVSNEVTYSTKKVIRVHEESGRYNYTETVLPNKPPEM